MAERRLSALIAVAVALLIMAVLWDAFAPQRRPVAAVSAEDTTLRVVVTEEKPPATSGATQGASVPPSESQDHYMDLLARAETRRQIRASAGITYLSDILANSADSMLHRWDNRADNPVRVYLGPGRAANYQPAFLEAVRDAFRRWEDAGVPVRFDLSADSADAEVVFRWRVQFDIDRTGQTDLTWNEDGHLQSGVVTLATFNQLGQPMGPDEIRIVALHEIGHLVGLDHSPDSADMMYPVAKVRDLSSRDIQTAQLLYRLSPGSIR